MMNMMFGRWEAGGVEAEQASRWGRAEDKRRRGLGSSIVSDAFRGELIDFLSQQQHIYIHVLFPTIFRKSFSCFSSLLFPY